MKFQRSRWAESRKGYGFEFESNELTAKCELQDEERVSGPKAPFQLCDKTTLAIRTCLVSLCLPPPAPENKNCFSLAMFAQHIIKYILAVNIAAISQ